MDRNGFIEGKVHCKSCGKELSGEDGPRPAETYVGSFTGLCYECEKGGSYIVEEHFDGAVTWSHPPHCPSWRRSREIETGYPDCPECKGTGHIYVSRWCSEGGSYYKYCETCFERFYNHPRRKADEAAREEVQSLITEDINDAMESEGGKMDKCGYMGKLIIWGVS